MNFVNVPYKLKSAAGARGVSVDGALSLPFVRIGIYPTHHPHTVKLRYTNTQGRGGRLPAYPIQSQHSPHRWVLFLYPEVVMIYKRCPHCGRRIPSGTTCPCYKRQYAPTKEGAEFYHTQRWQKLRTYIIAKFGGLDPWAQSKGRIEYASTVPPYHPC